MKKYNTKDKDYKEWLRLKRIENEIVWTWEKSQEQADIDKLLENPKFIKYSWWYDTPPKWFVKCYHKSNRRHNKQALKANILYMPDPYDEHPMDDGNFEWKGNLKGWESEYINYTYQHRNNAQMWWNW